MYEISILGASEGYTSSGSVAGIYFVEMGWICRETCRSTLRTSFASPDAQDVPPWLDFVIFISPLGERHAMRPNDSKMKACIEMCCGMRQMRSCVMFSIDRLQLWYCLSEDTFTVSTNQNTQLEKNRSFLSLYHLQVIVCATRIRPL